MKEETSNDFKVYNKKTTSIVVVDQCSLLNRSKYLVARILFAWYHV